MFVYSFALLLIVTSKIFCVRKLAIVLPKSMTTGSAGPFGTISTKIRGLTNNTTINDAIKKIASSIVLLCYSYPLFYGLLLRQAKMAIAVEADRKPI